MQLRTAVKFTLNAITGVGAYGLTRQIIDNNTDDPETVTEKVLHEGGSIAVAGLVADAASDRIDKMVDRVFDHFNKKPEKSNS